MRSVIAMFCIGLVFGYLVAGIDTATVAPNTDTAPSVHETTPEPQVVAQTTEPAPPEPTYKTITLGLDGIRFAYRTMPDGYDVARVGAPTTTDAAFFDGYQLTRTSDAETIPGENTEGPQSIQILILKNPDKLSPRVWAMQNTQYSNANSLQGEMTDETFGTQSSVTYHADGLYTMEYHIVSVGKYIYVLVGSYDGDASPLKADFKQFLSTFEFIPAS